MNNTSQEPGREEGLGVKGPRRREGLGVKWAWAIGTQMGRRRLNSN